MNISFLLANSGKKYPDRIALISEGRRFTYHTLNLRVNKLANAMLRNGLRKGDRVAIMSRNTHQFAEIYFAAARAEAVATPVNFRFLGEEVKYVLNNSGARFFSTLTNSMKPLLPFAAS